MVGGAHFRLTAQIAPPTLVIHDPAKLGRRGDEPGAGWPWCIGYRNLEPPRAKREPGPQRPRLGEGASHTPTMGRV